MLAALSRVAPRARAGRRCWWSRGGRSGGADVFFVGGGVVRHQAAVSADDWADGAEGGLAVLRRLRAPRSAAPGPLAADALDEAAIVGDRLEALRGSAAAVELRVGLAHRRRAGARSARPSRALAVAVPEPDPDAPPDDDPPED